MSKRTWATVQLTKINLCPDSVQKGLVHYMKGTSRVINAWNKRKWKNETVWNLPSYSFESTGSLWGAVANVTACFFAHAGVAMLSRKGKDRKKTQNFMDQFHLKRETLCCRIGRFMCMASLQFAILFGNILTVLYLDNRWYWSYWVGLVKSKDCSLKTKMGRHQIFVSLEVKPAWMGVCMVGDKPNNSVVVY